jgi:hypothetical protein
LQVGLATVNTGISYLRNQAKTNIKKYIDERLPVANPYREYRGTIECWDCGEDITFQTIW